MPKGLIMFSRAYPFNSIGGFGALDQCHLLEALEKLGGLLLEKLLTPLGFG
jgi:hypothetical protein